MSFGGKSPFTVHGPKKNFIQRLRNNESNVSSTDSILDSPLTTPSPGSSFNQSLSPISLLGKDSPNMPVSESPSDNSADVGVESLISPSAVSILGDIHYGLDDHHLGHRKSDSGESSIKQFYSSLTHPEQGQVGSTSHELSYIPDFNQPSFEAASFAGPFELCPTSDTMKEHVVTPRSSHESSFDTHGHYKSNRKHSPKRDYAGVCSEQQRVSSSTATSSKNSQKNRETSPNKVMCSFVSPGPGSATKKKHSSSDEVCQCQVCDDISAGFHCGAYVCEACKDDDVCSFFRP